MNQQNRTKIIALIVLVAIASLSLVYCLYTGLFTKPISSSTSNNSPTPQPIAYTIDVNGNLNTSLINDANINLILSAVENPDGVLKINLNLSNLTKVPSLSRFKNIKELSLSNNNLTTLDKDSFAGLSTLEKLDLDNNLLTELFAESFSSLINLQSLSLHKNALITIKPQAFLGLDKLKSLNLNNNFLSNLMDISFAELTSLIILHLQYNQFTTIKKDWFTPLPSLQILWLSNNSKITGLEANCFEGLINLKKLHLPFYKQLSSTSAETKYLEDIKNTLHSGLTFQTA